MDWLWYILISLISGTFAGMGMGGGTFLIPLLTIFMHTSQTNAQAQNLVVFVPMAIIVSIIYSIQKLIDWKRAWIVALPATSVAVVGSILAVNLSGNILRIIFGCFVAAVGAWQLISILISIIKKNKNKKIIIKSNSISIKK